MPVTCSASFCSYSQGKVKSGNLDILFHKFPTDLGYRKKWEAFCEKSPQWRVPKFGHLCSLHFTEDDYQMSRSPLLKTCRMFRTLKLDAVPSVKYSQPITIAKRKAMQEEARKQLYDELYSKNNSTDAFNEWMKEQAAFKSPLPGYVYRMHQFPNLCAYCFTPFTDKKQFIPLNHYHEELCCTIEQLFDKVGGTPEDEEDCDGLQNLLPKKVCAECVEALVKFHKYQRQLQCLKKFSTGMAQLRKGNAKPLQILYATDGDFLSGLLKDLNICTETKKELQIRPELDSDITLAMDVQEQLVMESESFEPHEENVETVAMSTPPLTGQKRARITRRRLPDGNFKDTWWCPFANVCNKWFEDQATLNRHMASQHKYFKCETCGLKMKFYDVYKKHIESHAVARALLLCHNGKSTNTELKCLICWKVFQSAELLERHKKTHTVAVGNSVFVTMEDQIKQRGVSKLVQKSNDILHDDACNMDPLSLEAIHIQPTLPTLDHDYV